MDNKKALYFRLQGLMIYQRLITLDIAFLQQR